MRSPKGLFGRLAHLQCGTAEAVLGVVAVVLIVWLLWPEAQGPSIDQRVAWQQSVEEAERRRLQLKAEQPADNAAEIANLTDQSQETVDAAERPAARERRRIARPSELADRRDFRRSFQPAPQRPEKASLTATGVKTETKEVQAALGDVIASLKAEPKVLGDGTAAGLSSDGPGVVAAGQDVPVLSSESLDAVPLADIDLSDLDTLVPLTEAAAPLEDAPPSEETALAAIAPAVRNENQEVAIATPSRDAAIEPFAVERDPASPTTDVRARPRDDAPSWLKNAVHAAIADDRPIIAVVIDDLGLNRPNTAALNDLPPPLTLAFLPYAGRIEAQTEAAHAAGHELMLHMPMEPFGTDWPGPDALTTRLDQEEFTQRLLKNLGRFDGFVGINNHMGSRLTSDASRMDVVMQELRKRDVLFLDSKTSARSVAGDVAGQNGVPNTTRDVFLDHVIDLEAIKRQLALTEKVARRTGSAVAIGHPHGATIQALHDWLPTLEARGFTLAPISAVVARRACSSGVLIAATTCGRYLQARRPASAALAAKDG